MERGQGCVVRERLFADRRHRVGEGDRGGRGPVERAVGDLGEAVQVRAQVHLGHAAAVEGAVRDLHGSTQVNALELGHVPECSLADRLEGVGQGHGRDGGLLEGAGSDLAQRVRQGHRLQLCDGESADADRCCPLGHRVRSCGVLARWEDHQGRAVLGVDDAVDAGVGGVGFVDLDARQARGTHEGVGEPRRGDVGAEANRGQVVHVGERVVVDVLDRARQGHCFEGRIGECLAAYPRKLRGVLVVILEGDLLQVCAVERLFCEGLHAGGHPDAVELVTVEGATTDLRDAVRYDDVRGASPVAGEDAAVVDDEVVGGLGSGDNSEGNRDGLLLAPLRRDGCGESPAARLIRGCQDGCLLVRTRLDGSQRRGTHSPLNRAPQERGREQGVQEHALARGASHPRLGQLDPGVVRNGANSNPADRLDGGVLFVGSDDRDLTGAHGRHEAVIIHGCQRAIGGFPRHVGASRGSRVVGCFQRQCLPGSKSRVPGPDTQRGARDIAGGPHNLG